jgi:hypothetical protein
MKTRSSVVNQIKQGFAKKIAILQHSVANGDVGCRMEKKKFISYQV